MSDVPVENAVALQRLTVPMSDDEPPETPTRDVMLKTPAFGLGGPDMVVIDAASADFDHTFIGRLRRFSQSPWRVGS